MDFGVLLLIVLLMLCPGIIGEQLADVKRGYDRRLKELKEKAK